MSVLVLRQTFSMSSCVLQLKQTHLHQCAFTRHRPLMRSTWISFQWATYCCDLMSTRSRVMGVVGYNPMSSITLLPLFLTHFVKVWTPMAFGITFSGYFYIIVLCESHPPNATSKQSKYLKQGLDSIKRLFLVP